MNRATSPTGWARNPDGSPGYTWNPITGCLNNCEYCYARKLANGRLKPLYLANTNLIPPYQDDEGFTHTPTNIAKTAMPFYPRFWEERLAKLQRGIDDADYQSYIRQKGRGIFVCDMGDLFGIGVPEQWTRKVLETIGDDSNSMHRFYLLTKQPQNLIKFSPFPENCWVGVTATNADMCIRAGYCLTQIQASIKFLSLEPLLDWQHGKPSFIATMLQNWGINWLIIGACTGTKKEMEELCKRYPELTTVSWSDNLGVQGLWTAQPKIEWAREIVEAADKAGVPVFLKDNLKPLIKWSRISWAFEPSFNILRQEMPINILRENMGSR